MVQVVHIEEIKARNAKYVEIPRQLSESVKSALNRVGITKLYSHQVIIYDNFNCTPSKPWFSFLFSFCVCA